MFARNRVLSHVAQDVVRFWFGAVGGQCAQILGLLGPFWGAARGHVVDLEGPRGPFGKEQSRRMCTAATISLILAIISKS